MTDDPQMPLAEVKAMVDRLLETRSHWIFLPGVSGIKTVEEIHRKYYGQAESDEFLEIIIAPTDGVGAFLFYVADKRRLDAHTLETFLDTHPNPLEFQGSFTDMSEVDLVVLADAQDRQPLIRNFIRCFAPKLPPQSPGRWN